VKLVSLGGGPRPAGLTHGAGQPHLSTFGLSLRSRVFSCPLEPSCQFLCNSDLVWFDFLTKIHNSPKLWKLLC
jgi:hypothetical protein